MAKHTSRTIPQDLKNKWDKFINDYTIAFIETKMKEKDYVIGFGNSNKSFCYRLERELAELGGIRGANASKFGLYYGYKNNSKNKEYRPTLRFGTTKEQAFKTIKEDLVKLIKKTKDLKEFEEIKSKFRGMVKYKIMFIYNPSIMIPSFVKEDLSFFAKKLKLCSNQTFKNLQKELLVYKEENMPNYDNYSFARYLYEKYGRPLSKKETDANDEEDRSLNDKVWKELKSITMVKSDKDEPSDRDDPIKTKLGFSKWKRSPKIAAEALIQANFSCEYNKKHKSFIKRGNGKRYVEVHHLIPMCYQDDYSNSIDKTANVVCLCSECHNLIHYGKDFEKIIKELYAKRKSRIEKIGIKISEDELVVKYQNIFKKKN